MPREIYDTLFGRVEYTIPVDPNEWRHFIYIAGNEWPRHAVVDASRREEFEDLVLQLAPGEKWLGMLVDYA